MATSKKSKAKKSSNLDAKNTTDEKVVSQVATSNEQEKDALAKENNKVESSDLETKDKSVTEATSEVKTESKEEKDNHEDEKQESKESSEDVNNNDSESETDEDTDSKETKEETDKKTEKKSDKKNNSNSILSVKKEKKSLATTDEDTPVNEPFNARIIVITSGKGGVGKTTTAAAISTGLALKGHKTAVIDFDVGLRNLDLIMGCERRVVYDFISVLHNEARLNQALIKDRHTENLYILPASQTKDKEALSLHGVGMVLKELSDMGFEYIICDSPAGIETGALMALYYADEAIVTTNPEISSVRDSDRIIGILNAKSRRAVNNLDDVKSRLLLTRYSPDRVNKGEMLSYEDVIELLTIPLLGVIPESPDVLKASNTGEPIILNKNSNAGQAYSDAVERILGNDIPLRFTNEQKGFFKKLFGG